MTEYLVTVIGNIDDDEAARLEEFGFALTRQGRSSGLPGVTSRYDDEHTLITVDTRDVPDARERLAEVLGERDARWLSKQ